ncbi:MAG: UDP-N-acetylmuramoyl-tripeptide--D-alanyl-D-alanine ligase [Planctomycetota bacterium]
MGLHAIPQSNRHTAVAAAATTGSSVHFTLDELRRIVSPRLMTAPMSSQPTNAISGISTDTRSIQPGDLFVALVGPNFDGHHYIREAFQRGAAAAIVSKGSSAPGAAGPVMVVHDTLQAYGDIAHWHRRYSHAKVIGITGTCGKTTTKELIAHLLGANDDGGHHAVHRTKANHNNLIGVPQTLLGLRDSHRFAVVEMGTNAPGEIARLTQIVAPDAGVLTNVGAGHLDGLGSIEGVVREKSALLAGLTRDGVAIINFDCIHSVAASHAVPACTRVIPFGLDARCEFRADGIAVGNGTTSFRLGGLATRLAPAPATGRRGLSGLWRSRGRSASQGAGEATFLVPMPGLHNVNNALAAISVAWWAGVPFDAIRERLRTFQPPALRLTRRELLDGRLLLLDDCYNANPASMAGALSTLAQTVGRRRVAVLGQMNELGDMSEACHRQLGQSIARYGIELLITVGEQARIVASEARRNGVHAVHCEDACDAAELLPDMVADGDAVLVKGSRSVGLEIVGQTLTAMADTVAARWHQPQRRRA